MQALVDISANEGWLHTTLVTMHVIQMCVQARWSHDSSLLTLPDIELEHIDFINRALIRWVWFKFTISIFSFQLIRCKKRYGVQDIGSLAELLLLCKRDNRFLTNSLEYSMTPNQITMVILHVHNYNDIFHHLILFL